MSKISTAINSFRNWGEPHVNAKGNPFYLACYLSEPASSEDINNAWEGKEIPATAMELWKLCSGASLFKDITHEQWGLELLSPLASANRTAEELASRNTDYREGDVVIGEFIGDQELLLLSPSESGERKMLIVGEIDPRDEWRGVGEELDEFLLAYWAAEGDKFWEKQTTK